MCVFQTRHAGTTSAESMFLPVLGDDSLGGKLEFDKGEEGNSAEVDKDQDEGEDFDQDDLATDLDSLDGQESGTDSDIVAQPLDGSWIQWAELFGPLVGVTTQKKAQLQGELRMMTLCSGTDAPVMAMQCAAGKDRVRHILSCDNADSSFVWVHKNSRPRPEHFLKDVADLAKPKALCLMCEKLCTAHHQEVDLMVAGFPCAPYSQLNPKRFTGNDAFLSHPDIQVFEHIHDFLKHAEKPPKVVVLENVAGVSKSSKDSHASGAGDLTPADWIMKGLGGKKKRFGLGSLSRYLVRQTPPQSCMQYGLPIRRTRIFWVLLRRDEYCEKDMDTIFANLKTLNKYKIPTSSISSFVKTWELIGESDSDSEDLLPKKKKARVVYKERDGWKAQSEAFRKKHGLPSMASPRGNPYTGILNEDTVLNISDRELDVANVAYLHALAESGGKAPTSLCIDVSQSVGRKPWRVDGKMTSPGTKAKIIFNGSLLDIKTGMGLLGWPLHTLRVPDKLSPTQLRKLTGNMISPPVIGGIFLSMLAAIPIGGVSLNDTVD